jgi:hypothetical protein
MPLPEHFLSNAVDEVLGIYAPGASPLIKANSTVPADVTMAHERGHRELCDTSPLGQYMTALALTTRYSVSAQSGQKARLALRDAVEQCWSVQEGYATLRECAYCIGTNRLQLWGTIAKALPSSYRTALAAFPIDIEALTRELARHHGLNAEQRNAMLSMSVEFTGYVMAKAAMSAPLAQVLRSAAALPTPEVATAIRRNAPDTRLQKLKPHLTTSFAWSCLQNVIEGNRESEETRTTRPLDERLDALARDMAARAGIAYERSDAVDLLTLLPRLGCNASVDHRDGRDVGIQQLQAYSTEADVVGAGGDAAMKMKILPLEVAQDAYAFHLQQHQQSKAEHIVCELGAKESNGQTIAFIHPYCTKEQVLKAFRGQTRLSSLLDKVAKCDDSTAILIVMFAVRIAVDEVGRLPKTFAHRDWSWVVADALIGDRSPQWNERALAQHGTVYGAPVGDMNFDDRVPDAMYRVPATPTGNSGPAKEGYGRFSPVPDDVALMVLPAPMGRRARPVRVMPMNRLLHRNLVVASFPYACVGETLLNGYFSSIGSGRLG